MKLTSLPVRLSATLAAVLFAPSVLFAQVPNEAMQKALEQARQGVTPAQREAMEKHVREQMDRVPGIVEQAKKLANEQLAKQKTEGAASYQAYIETGQVQNAQITPDVLGIRVGMTDTEARSVLLVDLHYARQSGEETRAMKGPDQVSFPGRWGAMPPDFTWHKFSGKMPPGERISYLYAGPREEVAVVERWQSLTRDKAFTEGNLRLALTEKYGAPSFQDSRWDDSMTWVLKGGRNECVPFPGHPLALGYEGQRLPEGTRIGQLEPSGRHFFIPWNWQTGLLEPYEFQGTPKWRYASLTTKKGCSYLRVLWGSDKNWVKGKAVDVATDDESLVTYIYTELVDYDRLVDVALAKKGAADATTEAERAGAGTRKPQL